MTRSTYYPGADTKTQNFAGRYVGSTTSPNVVVLHSTEGTGWPAYSSGGVAPHFTIMPDFARKRVVVRQHFPVNRSARALENRAGGVQTNTLNAVQIEMVGTCDPATHRKWGSTPHVYMPEAPDWFLEGVADVLRWLSQEWTAFPLKDAAPRGWAAYPGSYANGKGQRMSGAEWQSAYGVVGHQHVPENAHGDPGAFPIARTIAFAKGTAPPPATPDAPTEAPADVDVLDAANYPPKGYTVGPHVLWLGQRLVAHGFDKAYSYGPTPEWGTADRANVQAFQIAQGWTGSDADGYPGPETLRRLAAAPKPVTPPSPKGPTATTLVWNVSGYNDARGAKDGVDRVIRSGGIASKIIASNADVVALQELTNSDSDKSKLTVRDVAKRLKVSGHESNKARATMLKALDVALAGKYKREVSRKGSAVYRNVKTTKFVASGYVELTPLFKGNDKQAAWVVYEKNGVRALDASLHLTPQSGTDPKTRLSGDEVRVRQAFSAITQLLAVAKKYGVKPENVAISGDFNSQAWVADRVEGLAKPWRASLRKAATVTGGEWKTLTSWKVTVKGSQIDLHLTLKNVEVVSDTTYRDHTIADHNRKKVVRRLTA